eukprot:703315-Pelagomonas_calceolata.AAC.9
MKGKLPIKLFQSGQGTRVLNGSWGIGGESWSIAAGPGKGATLTYLTASHMQFLFLVACNQAVCPPSRLNQALIT